MKAIAVIPGKANSLHLTELAKPSIKDIPNDRGVLVQILRVGVDGTDKEINAAEYGQAPPGYEFLVIGHECFGRVVEVGKNVAVGNDYPFGFGRAAGSEYDLNHVTALKRRRSVGRAGAASNQLRDGLQIESGKPAPMGH